MPLVLWYGSTDLNAHPDLYKAQLDKLGKSIDGRLVGDVDARASGILVNASGWIEDMGYTYLIHAIDALRINVVLVMGHDRLYAMLGSHLKKKAAEDEVVMFEMYKNWLISAIHTNLKKPYLSTNGFLRW